MKISKDTRPAGVRCMTLGTFTQVQKSVWRKKAFNEAATNGELYSYVGHSLRSSSKYYSVPFEYLHSTTL